MNKSLVKELKNINDNCPMKHLEDIFYFDEPGYLDPNLKTIFYAMNFNESILLSNIDRTSQKQFCVSFPILFWFHFPIKT